MNSEHSSTTPEQYAEWVGPNRFVWHDCKPGYVYVVHFGDRIYKIGKAQDVDRRRRAFGDHELILVFYDWADVDRLERGLHRRFAHRRLYGELFRLTPDDVLDLGLSYEVSTGRQWKGAR